MTERMWWLDDTSPWEQDELGFSFGDVVGVISDIATAPAKAVASVLPKPLRGAAEVALNPVGAAISLGTKSVVGGGGGGGGGGAPPRPLPPKTTVQTQAAKNLRALAAAKPPGMSQADYIRALNASKQGVKPGAVSQGAIAAKKAADLRALAAAKPPGMSQADYVAYLQQAKAAKAQGQAVAPPRPKLVARSTGGKKDGQATLIQMVADAVNRKLSPDLNAINRKLALAENQRLATSEHNAINNKTAFRRKVLQDLMRMSSCLPDGDPVKGRIRKLGIMSGLV